MSVRQTAVPLGGAIAAVVYPSLYDLGGIRLTLGLSAVAVVVTGCWFALTVTVEPAMREPTGRRSLVAILRTPGMPLLLAIAACYIVVLQALLAYLVPAVREAGQSELTASVAFFSMNAAAMVARIGWGSVADGAGGSRRVRTLVEVGAVASTGSLVFGVALHAGPVAVVVAAIVFGLGAFGWNALVYVSAGERVDPSLAARSVAVAATVVFVLSGVATPLLGALVDAVGWDALWLATAVIAAVGAYLAHRLPPQTVAGAS